MVVAPPEALPLVERVAKLASGVSPRPRGHVSAISEAIDEVTDIIEQLRRTVEQMEEVLELVEVAERQKIGDEREIEALRGQLRQLHHPRDRRSRESEGQETR
jgi:predicted RNase H-like nuclease (RuvC/YqgF family)